MTADATEPDGAADASARRWRRLTLTQRVGLLIVLLLVLSAGLTILFSVRSVQQAMEAQSAESAGSVHAAVTALLAAEYQEHEQADNPDLQGTLSVLASTFAKVDFSEEGFPFILGPSGQTLVAPPNDDTSWLGDTPDGQQVAVDLVAQARAAGVDMATSTVEADLDGKGVREWVTTVSRFAQLDWTVVTAVPYSQLAAPGRQLAIAQAVVCLGIVIIGLTAGLVMTRRLARPVEEVIAAAQSLSTGTFDPASLDRAADRTDELGELARTFRRAAVEMRQREQELRATVARLTVQIDHDRVATSVAEIADTDYFRSLQERSADLRRHHRPSDEQDSDGTDEPRPAGGEVSSSS